MLVMLREGKGGYIYKVEGSRAGHVTHDILVIPTTILSIYILKVYTLRKSSIIYSRRVYII